MKICSNCGNEMKVVVGDRADLSFGEMVENCTFCGGSEFKEVTSEERINTLSTATANFYFICPNTKNRQLCHYQLLDKAYHEQTIHGTSTVIDIKCTECGKTHTIKLV